MMMRKILTTIIPALLTATAANAAEVYNKEGNKLDLYGLAKGLRYFSGDNANNGDKSFVRFGFKGQTQISEEVTGFGQWEYEAKTSNAESEGAKGDNKTRFGFAGLKIADVGSFDYGRNYAIGYDALAWTDMLPEFGSPFTATDTQTERITGVATWRNNNFFGLVDGLNVGIQYQGKNDRDAVETANGEGWGVSSSYVSPMGLGIVGAFSTRNRTEKQNNAAFGRGKHAEFWAMGVKYDANDIYLAATYGQGRKATPVSHTVNNVESKGFANKSQTFELLAQYQFDFGLRPSLAYIQGKAKDLENNIGNADLYKYVSVGSTYYFNKNMATYVDYKINLLKKDNALNKSTKDIVAVGLAYQF